MLSFDEMDYIVGEGAPAYPYEKGLQKFKRHLIFLKPNILIVVDDIALTASKPLELRFFTEQQNFAAFGSGYITIRPYVLYLLRSIADKC